jgi:ribosome-associated protein
MATKSKPETAPALLRQIVRALDDKQAGDLRVLNVGKQSSITDWLVLATGNSEPHLRALRIETERVLDEARAPIAGLDGANLGGSGWIVVDAYQIMVHLFTPEKRSAYALERLWRDAAEVKVAALLAPLVKPPAKRKSVSKPKSAPKAKARPKAKTMPKVRAAAPRRRKSA